MSNTIYISYSAYRARFISEGIALHWMFCQTFINHMFISLKKIDDHFIMFSTCIK